MKSAGAIPIFCALLGWSASGFASPSTEEESTVVVETNPISPTETTSHVASEISPQDLVGSGKSIGDALEILPGVHLRRFGSMGGLSSIVIRGLGMNYVNLVVDNIPLLQTGAGGIDLNLLPLSHIERIEVYRGGGPIELDAPIGGVVRIITRIPKEQTSFEAHLGTGSHSTRSGHVSLGGPITKSMRYHGLVHYSGTNGDFEYYNDNNTPYSVTDDFQTRRQQNASNAASALMTLQGDLFHQGLWSVSANGNWKQSQVPGPHLQFGLNPPDANALDQGIQITAELRKLTNASRTLEMNLQASIGRSKRQFTSDGPLLGFEVNQINSTQNRGALQGQFTIRPSLSHQLRASFGLHTEAMKQVTNVLQDVGIAANFEREETRAYTSLEFPAHIKGALELIPALRIDKLVSHSSLSKSITSTTVSPRLGFILNHSNWRLRGNIGRYHRFPNSVERFGDGLRIAPNPSLQPENGLLTDLNLGISLSQYAKLELSGFNTQADSLIVMLPTSQRYIRSYNLRSQQIRGIETHLQIHAGPLDGSVAYTLLASKGPLGTHTPGIPVHRVDSSISLSRFGLKLTYQPSYQTQIYLDPDNRLALPPKLMHNASARFKWEPWHLTFILSAQNLSNEQIADVRLPKDITGTVTQADFLGYPLAGRSFFGSVHWKY